MFHTYYLTNNKEDDIRSIQESYKKVRGKFPALQFPKYTGPMPKLSDVDAMILKTVYSAKGMATRLEIAAKLKANKLTIAMLDFLIEKGVLEKVTGHSTHDGSGPCYQITFAGKGCLLHLYPALNQAKV